MSKQTRLDAAYAHFDYACRRAAHWMRKGEPETARLLLDLAASGVANAAGVEFHGGAA